MFTQYRLSFWLVKQKSMRSASDLFSINCHLFTLNPITNLSQRKTLFQKFSFFKIIKINTTTELATLTANQIPSKIDGFWILWIFQNGTVLLIFYLFWCIIYALCIGGNCGCCCCNLIIFILFFSHNMRYDRSISKRKKKTVNGSNAKRIVNCVRFCVRFWCLI